ncbi:hypothetical protein FBD94_20215 [Pedobacter hiemivivus]|uniref:Uncharacterized protein n=1 Tax=Pedobacter hiemivivus TaxID=2530454 RepID=A0A4U1G237_9SPHI|nr:hypothetical protein [Pedobacter hiemivivus]TKC57607.1 hypothetical protein FBD94_20215 [Pedobacter hiemivivus]
MEFEQSTRVIYLTDEGEQVFTFIKDVNEKEGLYILDFEDVKISENKLKLNTYSNFSVPHAMSKDHIKAYHYDQLINLIVAFLKDHHAEEYLEIYRDMDTIYFETVFHAPKTPEEKKLFQEVVDKFNRIIGQLNSAVKSRFNQKIEVILKFPPNTHYLHSIRV